MYTLSIYNLPGILECFTFLKKFVGTDKPVIQLSFEDEIELEFEELSDKGRSIYTRLTRGFEEIGIAYSSSLSDDPEMLSEEEFYNILVSERALYK